jgi:pyridoxamine 5'-phosphate oxidase
VNTKTSLPLDKGKVRKGIIMNKQEILAFISKNNIGYLATVEGKAPRVRGMDTYRADENGLIFYTSKAKGVYQQIAANPEVEVCYFAKGLQVRVRGRMEMVEDMKLKKEIVAGRSFLGEYSEEDYKDMGVCRLKGKALTWTMEGGDGATAFVEL